MSRSGTGKKLKFKKKKNTKNKSRNTIITSSPPHPGQQQRSGKAKKHFSTFFSLGSLINRMRYQKAPKEQEQKQKNIDRPFCDTSKNQALRRQTHTHTLSLSTCPQRSRTPAPPKEEKRRHFVFFVFCFFVCVLGNHCVSPRTRPPYDFRGTKTHNTQQTQTHGRAGFPISDMQVKNSEQTRAKTHTPGTAESVCCCCYSRIKHTSSVSKKSLFEERLYV